MMRLDLYYADELPGAIEQRDRFAAQFREADAEARLTGKCLQPWIMDDVRKAEREAKKLRRELERREHGN